MRFEGQVVMAAESMQLRSGLRLRERKRDRVPSFNSLSRLAEVPPSTGDSDDDDDARAGGAGVPAETWAPRIARRGVPARASASRAPSKALRQALPLEGMFASTPDSPDLRVEPLPLIRSGASDLLGGMALLDDEPDCRAPTCEPALAPTPWASRLS
jgi:hypothetical protein